MDKKRLFVCVSVVMALSLTACGSTSSMTAPELLEPVSVVADTTPVYRGNISFNNYYDGEIMPQTYDVKSEEGGIISEVMVSVGDYVEEGQMIARYTDEAEQAELTAINNDISYMRKKYALENEILSISISETGSELDKLKLKQQKETQALELSIAEEKKAEVLGRIGDCDIYAPANGHVVFVTENGMVARDGYIALIASDTELVGRSAFINDQTLSRADGVRGFYYGEMIDLTPRPYNKSDYVSAILRGGTFYSYYDLESVPEGAKAGDYLQLIISNRTKENVLLIPVTALQKDADGYYVYKCENDSKVKCKVAIGLKNELIAEVLDGLSEGEEVYVSN